VDEENTNWALAHNWKEFWAKAKNTNHSTHDLKVVAIEQNNSIKNSSATLRRCNTNLSLHCLQHNIISRVKN